MNTNAKANKATDAQRAALASKAIKTGAKKLEKLAEAAKAVNAVSYTVDGKEKKALGKASLPKRLFSGAALNDLARGKVRVSVSSIPSECVDYPSISVAVTELTGARCDGLALGVRLKGLPAGTTVYCEGIPVYTVSVKDNERFATARIEADHKAKAKELQTVEATAARIAERERKQAVKQAAKVATDALNAGLISQEEYAAYYQQALQVA